MDSVGKCHYWAAWRIHTSTGLEPFLFIEVEYVCRHNYIQYQL